MTLHDTGWAWDQVLPPTEKLCLVALSEALGDASVWQEWTQRTARTAARLTGLGGVGLANAMIALADRGLIEWGVVEPPTGGLECWCVRFGYPVGAEEVSPTPRRTYSPRRDDAGYVYVLRSGNYYKIGKSKHANKRIAAIQTASPFKVVRLARIETLDMDALERYLHRKFADKRVNGEWFELDDDDFARLLTELREASIAEAGESGSTSTPPKWVKEI